MKNVSTEGFTICAKKMVDFSSPFYSDVNYVAFTEISDTMQHYAPTKI